jgi:hypothetical protein
MILFILWKCLYNCVIDVDYHSLWQKYLSPIFLARLYVPECVVEGKMMVANVKSRNGSSSRSLSTPSLFAPQQICCPTYTGDKRLILTFILLQGSILSLVYAFPGSCSLMLCYALDSWLHNTWDSQICLPNYFSIALGLPSGWTLVFYHSTSRCACTLITYHYCDSDFMDIHTAIAIDLCLAQLRPADSAE